MIILLTIARLLTKMLFRRALASWGLKAPEQTTARPHFKILFACLEQFDKVAADKLRVALDQPRKDTTA